MSSTLLHSFVEVESNSPSLPEAPQKAVPRTYPAVPQQEVGIQLENLPQSCNDVKPSAPSPPPEERDLESSFPGTPAEPADVFEAIDILPSLTDPPMNRFRLAACCFQNFLGGLTDSAPGALIPYMETHYDIGYAVVSLIFVGNALGFIMAAPFVDQIRLRLGRAKSVALSQACMALGYLPMICAAPFPVVVISYFFIGFGFAVNLAIGNVFCANLRNGTTMLGAMGGIIGPLVATSIVSSGAIWSRYYLLTLGFALFNFCFSTFSFWNYEKELGVVDAALLSETTAASRSAQQMSAMLIAFKSKVVLLGAIFIFAYQGAEVSISGWVISFLITARDGQPSSVGYVTSGFWGGITLGRFLLSPVGARIGEKVFVYALVVGAAVFQLLVWLVPNVIGEAVSLAIVGLLLGPIYPCAAVVFTRNLSRPEQVSGMGLISAFGSSGGAVVPFTTGLLAQIAGPFVLHPIAISFFALMVLCWFGQPSIRKRTE
ncbi:MFS general substrate transporter [Xylariaceae sp. FL0662B]|nr:MFS general substrate transporter [Xylariaceae sp. FL0662B]